MAQCDTCHGAKGWWKYPAYDRQGRGIGTPTWVRCDTCSGTGKR